MEALKAINPLGVRSGFLTCSSETRPFIYRIQAPVPLVPPPQFVPFSPSPSRFLCPPSWTSSNPGKTCESHLTCEFSSTTEAKAHVSVVIKVSHPRSLHADNTNDILFVQSYSIAVLTILFYDHLLTLSDEVRPDYGSRTMRFPNSAALY